MKMWKLYYINVNMWPLGRGIEVKTEAYLAKLSRPLLYFGQKVPVLHDYGMQKT